LSLRALSKGFVLAKRSKKTWVFTVLFMLLVWLTITNINDIHKLETDSLLNLRGVSVSFRGGNILTEDRFDNSDFSQNILREVMEYSRGIYLVCGAVLDLRSTKIGLIWVKPYRDKVYRPEMPWIVQEIKPTKIIEGRAINMDADDEALVGREFSLYFQVGENNIYVSAEVGSKITIEFGSVVAPLVIVGVSSDDFSFFAEALSSKLGETINTSSILFTTQRFIDSLGGELVSRENTYVLRVIITASGEINIFNLFSAGGKIDQNRDKIKSIIIEGGYSGFIDTIAPELSGQEYQQSITIIMLSVLIMLLITMIYAFILVSFRKTDIATLRAIGWGSKHIFALAFGEFVLTILLGYFLGAVFSAAFFLYNRIPFSGWIYLVSLGIVFVSILVGLIITHRRVLKIPPMEAFRAR